MATGKIKEAFVPAPDNNYLRGVLDELSGERTVLPPYLRTVEGLLEEGVPVPTFDPTKDKGKPTEQYLLSQILNVRPIKDLPQGIVDYMSDREYIKLPLTVRSYVRRETQRTLVELTTMVTDLNTAIKEQKQNRQSL